MRPSRIDSSPWIYAGSLLLLVGLPGPVLAEERTFTASAVSGARFFNEELGLETSITFGARLGMGLSRRSAVLFDFVASHPSREGSGVFTAVDALRVLARVNVLKGDLRPYGLAGVGGVLFDFTDTAPSAALAFTLGGGAEYRVGKRLLAFLEGSGDVYWHETVFFSPSGRPYIVEPQTARFLGTISAGIGVEF